MIILDTCVIIWDALDRKQLSSTAKKKIDTNHSDDVIVSDISLWEISLLIHRKRLKIDVSAAHFLDLYLQARGYLVQPITSAIAELSVGLDKSINNDPADRLIAATSIVLNASLITADNNLRKAKILNTIW